MIAKFKQLVKQVCPDFLFLPASKLRSSLRTGHLATTNYPLITRNTDIVTGDFRAINLRLPPFCLPKPVTVIPEDLFPEHKDNPNFIRELGLWRGSDFARWQNSKMNEEIKPLPAPKSADGQ